MNISINPFMHLLLPPFINTMTKELLETQYLMHTPHRVAEMARTLLNLEVDLHYLTEAKAMSQAEAERIWHEQVEYLRKDVIYER